MNYDPKNIREIRPFLMLMITLAVALVVGLAFQITAAITAPMLFDITITEAFDLNNMTSPDQLAALKYIQILGALGTFIISSLLLSRFYTNSFLGYFSVGSRVDGRSLIFAAVVMLLSLPFVNWLTEINLSVEIPFENLERQLRSVHDRTEELMMTLVSADNFMALLVNLFMIAVIPAVGEELLFRGLIQQHFQAWFKNGHVAVIATAVVFSLAHFQVYSFLPRFFLGLLLGYMFFYGKSLWYPILGHFVNNGLGVIFYYFQAKNDSVSGLDEIGTEGSMPATAILSAVLITGLFYVWVRMMKANQFPQSGQT